MEAAVEELKAYAALLKTAVTPPAAWCEALAEVGPGSGDALACERRAARLAAAAEVVLAEDLVAAAARRATISLVDEIRAVGRRARRAVAAAVEAARAAAARAAEAASDADAAKLLDELEAGGAAAGTVAGLAARGFEDGDGVYERLRRLTLSQGLASAASATSWPEGERGGLTRGAVPALAAAPGAECGSDAPPRARAFVYDLAALLRPLPGTTHSGLNFRLVKELDTIRELQPAPSAEAPAAGATRCDAPGVHRAMTWPSGAPAPAAAVHAPPAPALLLYHALAEEAVFSAPGFLFGEPASLSEAYSELEAEAEREVAALLRAPEPATWDALVAERAQAAELWGERHLRSAPLPGASLAALQAEAAVSAYLQGERVARQLKRVPPGKAGEERLRALLGSEEPAVPSLKAFAAARASPI